jgi:hypothetical protein
MGAVRLSAPLRIDGHLDEAVYAAFPPISDFIQMEPKAGEPATEKTEVWVFFDQHNVYVAMRAWESRPDLVVANEMRRDSGNIRMGDCVGFSFDTFHDGRNAFQFEVSPLGARVDGQSTNERQFSTDWNPVWDLAVGRFAGGWTVEAAIPFKALRYQPGAAQVWGFNARRNNKWKNEIAFLARVPAAFGIGRGSFAASLFPTLTGIDAPPGSKNLEVKPYVVADLTTDRSASPAILNDPDGHVGLDVKYGVTQSLTADFTYNTDFAAIDSASASSAISSGSRSRSPSRRRRRFRPVRMISSPAGSGTRSASSGRSRAPSWSSAARSTTAIEPASGSARPASTRRRGSRSSPPPRSTGSICRAGPSPPISSGRA